jgi:predicted nuclease of predicted toxin-antitoxin system
MRLLADENFPRPSVEALRQDGHDVVWVRTDCPASKDAALLVRAEAEGRLVLTLDKDFWQLARQSKRPLRRGGVILFRVHPAVPATLTPLVRRILSQRRAWKGRLSTVTGGGLQVIQVRSARRARQSR